VSRVPGTKNKMVIAVIHMYTSLSRIMNRFVSKRVTKGITSSCT
jgi:hypothetical protein